MAPKWFDELPLRVGPPHHAMGVRPLAIADWLIGGDDLLPQLAEKHRLLVSRHAEVVAALPGSEPAGEALRDLVADWLTTHRSDAVRASNDPAAVAPARHGVDAAARLIAEDLCLLERRNGSWVLTAASVCFPSRWRLHDKLGLPVADIHRPVPHYEAELARPVDRFLDRLRSDRPVWRRNVLLHADPALFQPSAAPLRHRVGPHRLWLRSERQTLRRFPVPSTGDDAVVFTIRTQQVPLTDLRAPAPRRALGAMLRSLDGSLADYKVGDVDVEAVVPWLEGR